MHGTQFALAPANMARSRKSGGLLRWACCCWQSHWAPPPAKGITARQRILVITALGVLAFASSTASAQQSSHTATDENPKPVRRSFAVTSNPLNLVIGRYGFNFEYQPVLHHGIIVSPHYDYLSGNPGQEGGSCNGRCAETLSGAGTEFGYRFYSGNRGFNGIFVGPSLIIARHKSRFTYSPWNDQTVVVFNEIGAALDIGGQWQLGHFVIGGGIGVQFSALDHEIGSTGRGIDILIQYNAGGSLLPRLLFNLGYAF